MLAELEGHPHATAVLGPAVPPSGDPSHAYLLHGPAGSGKEAAALAFAAELLADGAADPDAARRRVRDRVHPDLTWVRPSGAAAMVKEDVEDAVVAAVSHTPFEARRRVFVLERADLMNDTVANRMLKTLEEPPDFAHLILLTDRPANVLPTIRSRCLAVRFEAASAADIEAQLRTRVPEDQARACARLALGDADRALELALGDGPALRHAAEAYARACVSGDLSGMPWSAVLDNARTREQTLLAAEGEQLKEALELLPSKERKKAERDGEAAIKRRVRRERTAALDRQLQLAALWLRDVACVLDGAPELVFHTDRAAEVAADAEALGSATRAREGVSMVEDARTQFVLNPSEELALEALASRVERVLNP